MKVSQEESCKAQHYSPNGELFSRTYLERGAPTQDKPSFRNRLSQYLIVLQASKKTGIASYFRLEAGFDVSWAFGGPDFASFFNLSDIATVLDSVTLTWRYLERTSSLQSRDWHAFVSRTLREENMSYTLDEKCGVHFFIDEEFERNRVSALKCLDSPRYSGVRKAFEDAHRHLDTQPPDTKASVRSAFEALEILARLIDPSSKNLNQYMVKEKLRPLAEAQATHPAEKSTIENLFNGLAYIVTSLHNYRHGQGSEAPVAPTLTVAVFVLSTVAAFLRWLVEVDSCRPAAGDV